MFAKLHWHIPRSREPTHRMERDRYLEETLDTQVTWFLHTFQLRKKMPSDLECVLTRGLFCLPGTVFCCNQLIRPMMEYTCLIWKSATRIHVRKLQGLQSKCFRFATGALPYTGNGMWEFHSSPFKSQP